MYYELEGSGWGRGIVTSLCENSTLGLGLGLRLVLRLGLGLGLRLGIRVWIRIRVRVSSLTNPFLAVAGSASLSARGKVTPEVDSLVCTV